MSDDLTARCTALVRQAMEREPHDRDCAIREGYCDCTWPGRLPATLGRMMAAGIAVNLPDDAWPEEHDVALRAVEREMGGTE